MALPKDDDRWWAPEAKCLGKPPDFFFPVVRDALGLPVINENGSEKPDLAGVQAAKNFCLGIENKKHVPGAECPVRTLCLEWAILNDQWDGVFGGMVERERRRYSKNKSAGIGFGGGIKASTRPREV